MSITKKRILAILGIVLTTGSLGLFWAALPALGHESREGVPYSFEVGFVQEPVFRGFPNGVDIFITRTSDDRPINKKKGDVVDLSVEVQLRDREAFDSRIMQSAKLDPPTQAFDVENEYKSWFLPAVVGTYAFHITGTVSDDSDPKAGRQQIDLTFVCGKGSQDTDTEFDCVKAPQLFPSGQ